MSLRATQSERVEENRLGVEADIGNDSRGVQKLIAKPACPSRPRSTEQAARWQSLTLATDVSDLHLHLTVVMSGAPPAKWSARLAPPDRGSFPLDHEGECKKFMTDYLACLKTSRGDNQPCRLHSKRYLACRMDRGLMEKDDWSNLGYSDVKDVENADTDRNRGVPYIPKAQRDADADRNRGVPHVQQEQRQV